MALSRMLKLGEICCSRKTIIHSVEYIQKLPYNVRTFKRLQQKEPADSFTTSFRNLSFNTSNLNVKSLGKPFAFTLLFTTVCFGGATIWQYETMRAHAIVKLKEPPPLPPGKKPPPPAAKPAPAPSPPEHELIVEFKRWWKHLTPGEQVFVPICAVNILVFAAWKIPKMAPVMLKYFCSNPSSKSICWPMLLSTFSHYSAFHLLANMYVLHSFSTGAVGSLGKEQFLGLYLSAGVISSFTSYFYKALTRQPGLSLGASGAIMAILGYVCTEYPDTKLGIIFFPFLTFSAASAIKCIVGLDAAGVLLKWKFFDHAAHLGGAATGIAWAYWGNEKLWHKRDPLLQYWHEIRGAIK